MPSAALDMRILDPQALLASWRSRYVSHGDPVTCGFPDEGLGPGYGWPPENTFWVGFDYWRSDGWWCWESMDYVFRGGVQFDVSNFQRFYGMGYYLPLTAELQCWQAEPHDACATTLIYAASGDWANGVLDDYLVPTTGSDDDYVDSVAPFSDTPEGGFDGLVRTNVTPQFLDWISGTKPNFGFCFMGMDESMKDDANALCINQFQAFRLQINYVAIDGWKPEDLFPWDGGPILRRGPRNRQTFTMSGGKLPASLERRLQERHPQKRSAPQGPAQP